MGFRIFSFTGEFPPDSLKKLVQGRSLIIFFHQDRDERIVSELKTGLPEADFMFVPAQIRKPSILVFEGIYTLYTGGTEKIEEFLREQRRLLSFVIEFRKASGATVFEKIAEDNILSFIGGFSLTVGELDVRLSGESRLDFPDSCAFLLEEDFSFDYLSHAVGNVYPEEKFLKVSARENISGFELLVGEQLAEGYSEMYVPAGIVKDFFRKSFEGKNFVNFVAKALLPVVGDTFSEIPPLVVPVDSLVIKPHFLAPFYSEAAVVSLEGVYE